MNIALLSIALIFGAVAAVLLIHSLLGMSHQIVALENRLNAFEKRQELIDNIKAPKHYTYNERAAYGDALAVLADLITDIEAAKARANTGATIIKAVAGKYDPEQPAGKREVDNR